MPVHLSSPSPSSLPEGDSSRITNLVKEYKGPEAEKKGRVRSAITRALSFIAQPVTAKLAQKYEALEAKQKRTSTTDPHTAKLLTKSMEKLANLPGVKKTVQANAIKREIEAKRETVKNHKEQIKSLIGNFGEHGLIQRGKVLEDKTQALDRKGIELRKDAESLHVREMKLRLPLENESTRLQKEKERLNDEYKSLKEQQNQCEIQEEMSREGTLPLDQVPNLPKNREKFNEALKQYGADTKKWENDVARLQEKISERKDELAMLDSDYAASAAARAELEEEKSDLALDIHEFNQDWNALYDETFGDIKTQLDREQAFTDGLISDLQGTPLSLEAQYLDQDISEAKRLLSKYTPRTEVESISSPPVAQEAPQISNQLQVREDELTARETELHRRQNQNKADFNASTKENLRLGSERHHIAEAERHHQELADILKLGTPNAELLSQYHQFEEMLASRKEQLAVDEGSYKANLARIREEKQEIGVALDQLEVDKAALAEEIRLQNQQE